MKQPYRVPIVKLSYKSGANQSEGIQVKTPDDCYKVFITHWDKDQLEHKESFKMLLLNQSNVVMGIYNIAEGGLRATIVDVRIILQAAILSNATSIVLAHNHPSGDVIPGTNDMGMTKQIKQAAMYVDILLHDHIIVGKDRFYSFAAKGIL